MFKESDMLGVSRRGGGAVVVAVVVREVDLERVVGEMKCVRIYIEVKMKKCIHARESL